MGGAVLGDQSIDSAFAIATSPEVVRRALGYGIVVGAILVGINHGDALFRGEADAVRIVKMILTPMVPYAVSTLSSVSAIRAAAARGSAS
jgi:hypothetical protein